MTADQTVVADLRAWASELYAANPFEKEVLEAAIAAIDRLTAELAAMTAERDVWVKGFVREAYPEQSK